MTITDNQSWVTGANRGIGQALVAEAPAAARGGWTPVRAGPWPPGWAGHAPDLEVTSVALTRAAADQQGSTTRSYPCRVRAARDPDGGLMVDLSPMGSVRVDPDQDQPGMAAARRYGAVVEPFASGVYVNDLTDEGQAGIRRAYGVGTLARLAGLKTVMTPATCSASTTTSAPTRTSHGDRPTTTTAVLSPPPTGRTDAATSSRIRPGERSNVGSR